MFNKTKRKIENFDFFFIRGAPARSGTNWVNNLLNLHPEIHCKGEFNLNSLKIAFNSLIKKKKNIYQNPLVYDSFVKDFQDMIKNCIFNASISEIKNKPEVKWLGDRTPVRLSPVLIENKPHFQIYRDGRDVLVSLTYHNLRIDLNDSLLKGFPKMMKKRIIFNKNPLYFKDNPFELLDDLNWVQDVAIRWNNQMNLRQMDLEKVNHGLINAKIYSIKYEKLHADVENERRKMYNFLGLNPKKALPLDKRTRPGFRKEDPTSHYRKGIVGDWKNYFTKKVCKVFKQEAGQSLIDLGYEKDTEWESRL